MLSAASPNNALSAAALHHQRENRVVRFVEVRLFIRGRWIDL